MILKHINHFQLVIRFLVWIFANLVKDIIYWSNYYIKIYTLKKFVIKVLLMLRDFSLTTCKVLVDLTAVDYASPATMRFHLHYLLLSLQYNMRFQVCTTVAEKGQVLTSTRVFLNSLWLEREVWNMFGIRFMRNDTIRCILTDYGFRSHPLMKNFPMTGYWQHRYDEARRVILRYPVKLMQEYRRFTLSVETFEVKVDYLHEDRNVMHEDYLANLIKKYDDTEY
jgi:NADH-quinone oxidoreductase subunit C